MREGEEEKERTEGEEREEIGEERRGEGGIEEERGRRRDSGQVEGRKSEEGGR